MVELAHLGPLGSGSGTGSGTGTGRRLHSFAAALHLRRNDGMPQTLARTAREWSRLLSSPQACIERSIKLRTITRRSSSSKGLFSTMTVPSS
jgi:hypothetical protein